MIQSFADELTRDVFYGEPTARVRRVAGMVAKTALRKLAQLDAATRLEDLRAPPGNRLEALKGDRAGYHSIRVNDQWRVVFRWKPDGAHDVGLIDYH